MSRTPKPTFSLELLFQKEFLPFAGVVRLLRLLLANSTAWAFRVFDPRLQLLQNKFIKWAFFFLRGWPHLKSIRFELPLEYCLLKMRVNGADLGQTWNVRILQVSLGAGSQSWQRFLLLLLNPEQSLGSSRGARQSPQAVLQHRGGDISVPSLQFWALWGLSHHSAATSLLLQHIPSAQQKLGLNPGNSSWENQDLNRSHPVSRQNVTRSFESIQTRAAVTFWNPQDISEFFTTVSSSELNN